VLAIASIDSRSAASSDVCSAAKYREAGSVVAMGSKEYVRVVTGGAGNCVASAPTLATVTPSEIQIQARRASDLRVPLSSSFRTYRTSETIQPPQGPVGQPRGAPWPLIAPHASESVEVAGRGALVAYALWAASRDTVSSTRTSPTLYLFWLPPRVRTSRVRIKPENTLPKEGCHVDADPSLWRPPYRESDVMAIGSKKFLPCLAPEAGWRPPERCEIASPCVPAPHRHRRRDAAHAGCRRRGAGMRDPRPH
jgi:hypothetical protein